MKRWEVLIDGQPQGWVEAVDIARAIDAAYLEHGYSSRKTLTLRRDELSMHILIDTTNWKALAKHDSQKALAALALIQFNNIDTAIIRCHENRNFTVFESEQLCSIAASIGLDLKVYPSYSAKVRAMREAIEALEWLALPFTTEQLESQAYGIKPGFDRPMAFDPTGEEAKPLKAWHVEPQRNRARHDSPHWHTFASGLGYGAGIATPAARAHLTGACPEDVAERMAPTGARRTAGKGPPATPTTPKAPKAPAAPGTRPKEGTSTGKVWAAGDTVRAREPDLTGKDLKAAVMKECEALGVNPGTVNVQFGKWKSSVGL